MRRWHRWLRGHVRRVHGIAWGEGFTAPALALDYGTSRIWPRPGKKAVWGTAHHDAHEAGQRHLGAGYQIRAAEQPGSGLVRTLVRHGQKDPGQVYALAVFESEDKAGARAGCTPPGKAAGQRRYGAG